MDEPLRIVLVDDHPMFRAGVAASLAVDPAVQVVAEAETGEQALELIARLQPDLVLLDISLPGIDGIELVGQIAVRFPAVRTLMLTASDNQDSLMAALKSGAHGYVLKGIAARDLRSIVQRVATGETYITPKLASRMLVEFSRTNGDIDERDVLTPRETDVLDLLSRGMTNKQIGEALHLAEKTVKHHMTNILQKLHVRTRTEAALLALRKKT